MFFTIPKETMSRVKPGYLTFFSSARISCGVGIVVEVARVRLEAAGVTGPSVSGQCVLPPVPASAGRPRRCRGKEKYSRATRDEKEPDGSRLTAQLSSPLEVTR